MEKYADIAINPDILKALDKLGFIQPTPIQARIIEQFSKERRDIIAVAQTGTGKTAAFSLPILETIQPMIPVVQAIVLSPTRELALQIASDMESYAAYMKGVNNAVVYGGASIMGQIKELKAGVQIVIGTPGRTIDLIKRKKLDLSNVQWVVLDEADEMLSMGFKDDLEFILSQTPAEKTTLLFSATLPDGIQKIAKKYLQNAVEIRVSASNETAKNISHSYYVVKRNSKYEALKRIVDMHLDIYAIVFCRTRAETNTVASKLGADGYNADVLNGDLSQAHRDQVMQRFRDKQLQILVATDVAARGLDVDNLSHVIHYQLSDEQEVYVHRSGRTGRAGKTGESLSIVGTSEVSRIRSLEKLIGKNIELKKLPSGVEICKNRVISFIHNLQSTEVREQQIESLMPEAEQLLKDMSKETLIRKIVSLEFNMFLDYYQNEDDINVDPKQSKRERSDRSERQSDGRRDRGSDRRQDRKPKSDRGSDRGSDKFIRYFLNIGSSQDLNPKSLIQLINKNVSDRDINIGHIDIMRDFSFFEADGKYQHILLNGLKNASHNSHRVNVEVAQEAQAPSKVKTRKFRTAKRSKRRK